LPVIKLDIAVEVTALLEVRLTMRQ
jgi:hypothetical protein